MAWHDMAHLCLINGSFKLLLGQRRPDLHGHGSRCCACCVWCLDALDGRFRQMRSGGHYRVCSFHSHNGSLYVGGEPGYPT